MLKHADVEESLVYWRDKLEAFRRHASEAAEAEKQRKLKAAHDELAAGLAAFEAHYNKFRDSRKETIEDPDGGVHSAYDDLKGAFEAAIGRHGV